MLFCKICLEKVGPTKQQSHLDGHVALFPLAVAPTGISLYIGPLKPKTALVPPPQPVVVAPQQAISLSVNDVKIRAFFEKAKVSPHIRSSLKSELQALLNKPLDPERYIIPSLQKRLDDSGLVSDGRVYYRKMSAVEYEGMEKNNFKAQFNYTDTNLYRLWFTTSQKKADSFNNAASSALPGRAVSSSSSSPPPTSSGEVIVKMTFSCSLLGHFIKIAAPHQKSGVQADMKLVAIHREGFFELGNIDTDEQVREIAAENLDYNIGFTVHHSLQLGELLAHFEIVA